MVITPHKTRKPIASAWAIKLNETGVHPKSLSIKVRESSKLLFRDLFVHIDVAAGTFELPSAEIWVLDNILIDKLNMVLSADIGNIKELVEFEKGLRFAVLKIKDLLMLKFEFLANPYYLQGESNDLGATHDVCVELERLTEELKEIDGKSHCSLHEKILRSFNNVKCRWEQVFESGNLRLPVYPINQREMADRHFGFFACP